MPRAYYYKSVINVDAVTWTPVTVSTPSSEAGLNYLSVKNPNSFPMNIRTDSSDPTTQDTIFPGASEVIQASPWGLSQGVGNVRFLNGATVAYLQMASGTGTAVITGLL